MSHSSRGGNDKGAGQRTCRGLVSNTGWWHGHAHAVHSFIHPMKGVRVRVRVRLRWPGCQTRWHVQAAVRPDPAAFALAGGGCPLTSASRGCPPQTPNSRQAQDDPHRKHARARTCELLPSQSTYCRSHAASSAALALDHAPQAPVAPSSNAESGTTAKSVASMTPSPRQQEISREGAGQKIEC